MALGAIARAKELSKKETDEEYKLFLNKTLVYEFDDACIFQRSHSKSGRRDLRIYDDKKKKPVVRSLKTSDKTNSFAEALS